MNNRLLQLKIKQRLNKLTSHDYDEFECWQIAEAFNKAQKDWVRRQLHGTNQKGEGDEGSKRRVDDLNWLLNAIPHQLKGSNRTEYFESQGLPENYLEFKKVRAYATSSTCKKEKFIYVTPVEESNIDYIIEDLNRAPSFPWGETICTFVGGNIRVYTQSIASDTNFVITRCYLTYYRQPIDIVFEGCINELGQTLKEVQCEFKDDITEVLIDETAAILAGDIESWNQHTRESQRTELDN